ncbi:unnamed protein product [Adineta ricciae]|uniref:Uncharacterized protein n=1 Tax=Adineta ricciae TaxID=249248 RepID=A0A815QFP2_ADIRI|nr:unnamed protein product [Adineta ricciae]CAF1624308.1 unnamed protein product [Adineta ricciae]
MSLAISPDRKEDSTDNKSGAPDIAAQQIREHQAASHPSSSGQHHIGAISGQEKQSDWKNDSKQQIDKHQTNS